MTSSSRNDDPKAILDEAGRLISGGEYDLALEKLIWFHDHALEIDRSYHGVRLSYALADWIELGRKYPKALDALKNIRDKKTDWILAGNAAREIFHDVKAINDYLGELQSTVRLFKTLDSTQPAFAALVSDLVGEALVSRGEFAIARRYMGDPLTSFEKVKNQHLEGMDYITSSRNPEATRKAFEEIFSADVIRIITVLKKTGDADAAKKIQVKALTVLDNHAIREAIES